MRTARRRAAPVLSPVGIHAPDIGAELLQASPHEARRYLDIPRDAACSGLTTVQGTGCRTTRGLGNVATRGLDIAGIDLEADRWDAVISCRALMFMPDLAAALVGARRALRASERESLAAIPDRHGRRPGPRLAVIVWSTPERNPFHATPQAVLRAPGRPAPPDAEFLPASRRARRAGAGPHGRGVSRRRRDRSPNCGGSRRLPEAIASRHARPALACAMVRLDDAARAYASSSLFAPRGAS